MLRGRRALSRIGARTVKAPRASNRPGIRCLGTLSTMFRVFVSARDCPTGQALTQKHTCSVRVRGRIAQGYHLRGSRRLCGFGCVGSYWIALFEGLEILRHGATLSCGRPPVDGICSRHRA